MKSIFCLLKDILFPKKCYSCKREGYFLCPECFKKITKFKSICYYCKKETKDFRIHSDCKNHVYYDKVIILSHYKNSVIKKLIKDSKFYNRKDILEELGPYLGDLFLKNEEILNREDYIVLGSPMHFLRILKRGYNHSEILAKHFSLYTKLNYIKNLILKIRNTGQQSKLDRNERIRNIHNCFRINKKYIDNIDKKIFIVIDDVISTGSTLNEISKLLKNNGAKKIIGVIFASD